MPVSGVVDPIQIKSFFPPIGEYGHYLGLVKDKGQSVRYYIIRYVTPLPELVLHLNSATTATLVASGVTPGTTDIATVDTSASIRLQPLELQSKSNTMMQLRYVPLDDVEITMYKPLAVKAFATANVSFAVTPRITAIDPALSLTEFFVLEDDKTYMTAYNPTKTAAVYARVMFMGWFFHLEELTPWVTSLTKNDYYFNRIRVTPTYEVLEGKNKVVKPLGLPFDTMVRYINLEYAAV